MLTEDLAELSPPTEQELRDWLSAHGDDYRVPDLVSLRQVYFSIEADPEAARREATTTLASLRDGRSEFAPASFGDPSMLPAEVKQASPRRLGALFGSEFVAGIAALEPGAVARPDRVRVRATSGAH